ncbi:MAG TPA: Ppx/GppA phosphatase family protein [Nocardioidaceae bacterium]|nr:Ppx/GppA phosphatase family protein [Nocardioidaceae bacterium]
MTTVAALDCGTNSLRLLVAEETDRGMRPLQRELRIVRLGQDVDATGRFADEALERLFAACDEYAGMIERHRVDAVRFCATSAARDVDNRDVFAAGVRQRFGVDPEVISGDDEAGLTYRGATYELGPGRTPPYLVADIGGGSTELVLGDEEGAVRAARSLDIGSVRMTERHLSADPPTAAQVEAATRDVDAALDSVDVPLGAARTLIGVAGTVTTVAAMVLDLPRYDSDRVHHARLPFPAVHEATARLLTMTRQQRVDLPFMHPGRADVIGGGALLLDRLLARVAGTLATPEVVVSEQDVLDGIAASLLR